MRNIWRDVTICYFCVVIDLKLECMENLIFIPLVAAMVGVVHLLFKMIAKEGN